MEPSSPDRFTEETMSLAQFVRSCSKPVEKTSLEPLTAVPKAKVSVLIAIKPHDPDVEDNLREVLAFLEQHQIKAFV